MSKKYKLAGITAGVMLCFATGFFMAVIGISPTVTVSAHDLPGTVSHLHADEFAGEDYKDIRGHFESAAYRAGSDGENIGPLAPDDIVLIIGEHKFSMTQIAVLHSFSAYYADHVTPNTQW